MNKKEESSYCMRLINQGYAPLVVGRSDQERVGFQHPNSLPETEDDSKMLDKEEDEEAMLLRNTGELSLPQ